MLNEPEGKQALLKTLHRTNAVALAMFLSLHLANHFALMGGIEAHMAIQKALRPIYRAAIIEPVLIGLFTIQIALGLILVVKRGRPKERWGWLQVLSGGYLAFFLVQHLAAVLMARSSGFDTNSFFAAAVVNRLPLTYYFAPYYALSVAAVFAHFAAALRFKRWPEPPTASVRLLPWLGLVAGILIVSGLMGAFGAVRLSSVNEAYLNSVFR